MAKGQGRRNIDKKKVDEMLRRLADGESLRSICATEGMPAKCTVLGWVVDGKHPEFAEAYMTARRAAGFAHADRVVEVCDKAERGELPAQAARVMLQGLTWAAERMASKAHSTKQEVEHKGRIDGTWTITPVKSTGEVDD